MIDIAPIFIAGLSRCGKTLISSLLSSHPNIAIPPQEINLWTKFYNLFGDLSKQDNFNRCLNTMLQDKSVQCLKPDFDRIYKEFYNGKSNYERLFSILISHYAERQGKNRWGLNSVCLEYYVDMILEAFPTAKIIHMIRDPRDRYVSTRKNSRSLKIGKVAIATYNWAYSIQLAKYKKKEYPKQYRVICYEKLVSQPEDTIKYICEFLEESHSYIVSGSSGKIEYRGTPITTYFIGCFRRNLPYPDLAFMQEYSKRDMAAFRYIPVPISFSTGYTLLYNFVIRPYHYICIFLLNIMKYLYRRFPKFMNIFIKSPIMYSITKS
jgi:hypothetical protein